MALKVGSISFEESLRTKPRPIILDTKKTALVIVDMQNDFVKHKGKIYIGPMVDPTIAKIRSLLTKSRNAGARVIFTQSYYGKEDPRFGCNEKASRSERGCIAGSWGSEIIKELSPRKKEPCIRKGSYDCWFGTDLESTLRNMKFGKFEQDSVHFNRARNNCSVIITGTATNVCVDKAVTGFYLRGYDVIIPIDCVSAMDENEQRWAIYQFMNYYQARISSSELIRFAS